MAAGNASGRTEERREEGVSTGAMFSMTLCSFHEPRRDHHRFKAPQGRIR
jgi:hypothetical protein